LATGRLGGTKHLDSLVGRGASSGAAHTRFEILALSCGCIQLVLAGTDGVRGFYRLGIQVSAEVSRKTSVDLESMAAARQYSRGGPEPQGLARTSAHVPQDDAGSGGKLAGVRRSAPADGLWTSATIRD